MSRERVTRDRTRRSVLGATAGAATAALGAGAAGTAAAQEGGDVRPDYGGWLEGVAGGFRDARGEDEVTVLVGASGNGGAYAFAPANLWIDPGTTVRWRWTGDGSNHNVHAQEGADFESDTYAEAGVHFERTFEEGGTVTYQCDPHATLGMKGGIAVGDDVPTVAAGAGTAFVPPGGAIGLAFVALTLGTAGLAVAGVLAGEYVGSVRERAGEGPTSAYTAAGVVGVLALVLLVAVVVKLAAGT